MRASWCLCLVMPLSPFVNFTCFISYVFVLWSSFSCRHTIATCNWRSNLLWMFFRCQQNRFIFPLPIEHDAVFSIPSPPLSQRPHGKRTNFLLLLHWFQRDLGVIDRWVLRSWAAPWKLLGSMRLKSCIFLNYVPVTVHFYVHH